MIVERRRARLAPADGGYSPDVIDATTSELRIPATPAYIIVAKRAAAAFGYIAGFGVEAVDEVCIAVAQACENAIRCVATGGGDAPGQIRIAFRVEGQRLDIQVRSTCSRPTEASIAAAAGPAPALSPAGGVMRPAPAAPATVAQGNALTGRRGAAEQALVEDLALRVMGLFVDDCHYRVDRRTGGLRVRLTKYRAQ